MGDAAQQETPVPAIALRPPSQVMRLARMGSFFPTRLSFMPTLLREMARDEWRVTRPVCALDREGYGHVVYAVDTGSRIYSLVAFSHQLDPADRTDRVIAEAWDATFVLFDGMPDDADIDRLSRNAPKQEAGRFHPSELVLSRANRSVRIFEHVVDRLASGRQPDRKLLIEIGYLMRTTAVYGNGKFGIADRAKIEGRPELTGPFRAEMLTVYLIRCFTVDLVEHIARQRAPDAAVRLATDLKQHLGIGNATGLGMAPFLVSHPALINNWMAAREAGLAAIRSLTVVDPEKLAAFRRVFGRACRHAGEWVVDDARQAGRIAVLRRELATLQCWIETETGWLDDPHPWDALFRRAEAAFSLEGQEFLVALLLQPHGDLVDGLTDCMVAPASERLDPTMAVADLQILLQDHYGWVFEIDFGRPQEQRQFWYVSEEKAEPRLGDRYAEDGAEKEMPLAVARDVQALNNTLADAAPDQSVAAFVLKHPDYRHIIRRVQTVARHPYGEIRDNLIGEDCLPIDLLRCKLSFFGASKFDPKSDRWTRITLFQGAPFPEDLTLEAAEDWCFPALGEEA
ncbi:MAG: hypothetical protein RIM72_14855 [Alphaproteobacteria bacterium]